MPYARGFKRIGLGWADEGKQAQAQARLNAAVELADQFWMHLKYEVEPVPGTGEVRYKASSTSDRILLENIRVVEQQFCYVDPADRGSGRWYYVVGLGQEAVESVHTQLMQAKGKGELTGSSQDDFKRLIESTNPALGDLVATCSPCGVPEVTNRRNPKETIPSRSSARFDESLPAGKYVVKCSCEGFGSSSREVEIQPLETAVVGIDLRDYWLHLGHELAEWEGDRYVHVLFEPAVQHFGTAQLDGRAWDIRGIEVLHVGIRASDFMGETPPMVGFDGSIGVGVARPVWVSGHIGVLLRTLGSNPPFNLFELRPRFAWEVQGNGAEAVDSWPSEDAQKGISRGRRIVNSLSLRLPIALRLLSWVTLTPLYGYQWSFYNYINSDDSQQYSVDFNGYESFNIFGLRVELDGRLLGIPSNIVPMVLFAEGIINAGYFVGDAQYRSIVFGLSVDLAYPQF